MEVVKLTNYILVKLLIIFGCHREKDERPSVTSRVRKLNLGWCLLPSKVFMAVCGQVWKKNWGLMTLGQVISVRNFC